MESLQFHCLNVAVSLLSKQDMQKILLNRAIQIQKTRLFKYLECGDDDAARKIYNPSSDCHRLYLRQSTSIQNNAAKVFFHLSIELLLSSSNLSLHPQD
jgi:hypothetical protein